MKRHIILSLIIVLALLLSGCDTLENGDGNTSTSAPANGSTSPDRPADLETARVTRVIDGDTVELENGERVRLIGLNTPERDQPFYSAASAFTRDLIEGQQIGLEYDVESIDRYGRTLAYLWFGDQLVNQAILVAGYANAYTVPPNNRYSDQFVAAERYARENALGLWARPTDIALTIQHVEYNPPGEDLDGEFVTISNDGGSEVDLASFTLQDAANTVYTFPRGATLPPGQTLRVYTGSGNDTANTFYWGNGGPIWNNGGDVATLRDDQGLFLHIYRYGDS